MTDEAGSELLNQTLRANVHFGLRGGKPCWAKELLAGLQFADPNQDWFTMMLELKPIESPKAVAQLAKTKFTECILAFDLGQHPELCFTAGVKEFMAAAYDQELTTSFVECVAAESGWAHPTRMHIPVPHVNQQ